LGETETCECGNKAYCENGDLNGLFPQTGLQNSYLHVPLGDLLEGRRQPNVLHGTIRLELEALPFSRVFAQSDGAALKPKQFQRRSNGGGRKMGEVGGSEQGWRQQKEEQKHVEMGSGLSSSFDCPSEKSTHGVDKARID
jgi:hypothetical protein